MSKQVAEFGQAGAVRCLEHFLAIFVETSAESVFLGPCGFHHHQGGRGG